MRRRPVLQWRVARWLLVGVALLVPRGVRAEAAAPSFTLRAAEHFALRGAEQVPEPEVRAVLGKVPQTTLGRRAWAARAVQRVVALYRRRGYVYARAWWRCDAQGWLAIDLDEGKMGLAFVGASSLQALLFQIDVYLPGGVFHAGTLDRALADLKRKHDLLAAYYRVSEGRPFQENRLGTAVPQRRLRIFVLTRERFGWDAGLALDPLWGLVPRGGVRLRDALLDDDRAGARLRIAIPYRRVIVEDSPSFQWVHGQLEASYRLPRLFGTPIAPAFDGMTELSRYTRSEGPIQRYFAYRGELFSSLRLLPAHWLTLGVGVGVAFTRAFDVVSSEALGERQLLRYVVRASGELGLGSEALLRRDQRTRVGLAAALGVVKGETPLLSARLTGQYVLPLGRGELRLRGRVLYLAGSVRFWDEEPLGGEHLRTFFDNRYWVREAGQLGIAARWNASPTVQLGVFHDAALFRDRTRDWHPVALADAFGPSLHFLLFEQFSLDLYYAFGFAPVGFDHNFSGALRSAF
ncbi:MAG: hypothetical protein IPG96_03370 [Proteobacteria bacterium]|nr:hypothetical protein [Pseudomonadota bacterium]